MFFLNFSSPAGMDDSDKISNEELQSSESSHCTPAVSGTQLKSLFVLKATPQWIYMPSDLYCPIPLCRSVANNSPMQ